MSSVFGFGSPAAKNIQQIVYKLNESHYEDLNTRHYLCCQTHLLQLFIISGGLHLAEKETEIFLKSKKVTGLLFPFIIFL